MDFAIIGFGGLGKVHYGNVPRIAERVGDIRLVALCDVEESAFHVRTSTNLGENNAELDLSAYRIYRDVEELFARERLDFVITALPTYLHEKIAVMAMERGIHVFSEKPMALTAAQGEHMLRVAREKHVKLMIGQCVRYFPEYAALKELIDSNKYGKVIQADFQRISPSATWSWQNWMMDEAKSGGATLDLHVHDVDFIHWAFGVPKGVTSVSTNYKSKHESVRTLYHYEDKVVTALGDWGMPGCFPFTQRFTVRFERATVERAEKGLMLYPEEGEASLLEVPAGNGHAEELVDFINCIREDRESAVNPPEDSLKSIKIAIAEKVSADTGKTVVL